MSTAIILLHEEALRTTHPVFTAAPTDARAFYVWDDAYFQRMGYSLKRLVFIYETLCALPIKIVQGNTASVVRALAPSAVFMPVAHTPALVQLLEPLHSVCAVHIIADEPFVTLKSGADYRRFFHYWNKAQKTAFLPNGGADA